MHALRSSPRGKRLHALACAAFCSTIVLIAASTGALAQMPGGPPPGGQPAPKASGPSPFKTAFLRWDINHDSAVTCDEWRAYANRLFNSADGNRNDFLDALELRQIGRLEPILADADFSYFDENHDKRLSRKEFVDKPSQLFARFDVNRDCRVTIDEIDGTSRKANTSSPPGPGRRGDGPR